jgi:hypothetical protein
VPLALAGLLALASCQGDREGGDPGVCESPAAPTWDNSAEGFVATWCQPCHTETLVTVVERQGAPPGTDFDTWSQVYTWRERIAERVELSEMPPRGGIPQNDVDLFLQWIDCGAEGTDDTIPDCATPGSGGDATIASQAEADVLCATGGVALTSLTVSGPAAIDCACSVGGDVVLAPGSTIVSAPGLTSIGGSLRAESGGTLSSLVLPDLASVTGDVVVADEPALANLEFGALVDVGGKVEVVRAGLSSLDVSHLLTVGGAFRVTDDAALVEIDISRVRSIGGAMELTDLPAFVSLIGSRSLETVGALQGGGLVLTRLASLVEIDDLAFLLLEEVHGDVVVAENASLEVLDGFSSFGIDTFMFLPGDGLSPVELPHDFAIRITDLPQLSQLDGFGNLRVTNGLIEIRRSPMFNLSGFPNLRVVGGDLAIEDLDTLPVVLGFQSLETVGGTLELHSNLGLSGIFGMSDLATVGSNFEVTDNPALKTSDVEAWVAEITVAGEVVISGNMDG